MKVLILCAGYGTRLERDLRNDTSGTYQKLIGVPKPLLLVGKYPLISHWMRDLQNLAGVFSDVYVITNGSNQHHFERWSEGWPSVRLVCDNSHSNEERIGAVGCIELAVKHFQIKDHLLVIAGDTLFYEDFDLQATVNQFKEFVKKDERSNMVLHVNCPDEVVHKYGILETDESGRVTGFREKPQPSETTSRKQCPCYYFLNKQSLPLLGEFLEEKKNEALASRDATGHFIRYLFPRQPVYTVRVSGRFDVGGLDSYIECHERFLQMGGV